MLKNIFEFIFSLFIVALLYYISMPIMILINNTMINMGAPLATAEFLLKCVRWGFPIFLIAAIVVFFGRIFRKEPTSTEY